MIEGNPDCGLDGVLHRLGLGGALGFPTGTGIGHTFINNTEHDVRLLAVGDMERADNKVDYSLCPKKDIKIVDFYWHDAPKHELGNHDGLPDQLRIQNVGS
ncbi:MAG: hypothetical protein K2Q15_04395 [Burkholderiales bacterium]|nr:hypothetical protein [Burkholderiales bacterium]